MGSDDIIRVDSLFYGSFIIQMNQTKSNLDETILCRSLLSDRQARECVHAFACT